MLEKVAHYRRVLWLGGQGLSLQKILEEALATCPDVASTKFRYKNVVDVQIAQRDVSEDSVSVYFTTFMAGTPAATIEDGGSRIEKREAPIGEEYLKTGIMLSVSENHACYLADGHTNDGQVTAIVHAFLKSKNVPDIYTMFDLVPKPNIEEIRKLIRSGVKSIDLGLTNFETTVSDLNERHQKSGWLASLKNIPLSLKKAFQDGRSALEMEAASEIEVRVHLDYDGRGEKTLVSRMLGEIAESVNDSASEFKIVTKDDVVITRDKLYLKRSVRVQGDSVATDAKSAFSALKNVLHHWKSTLHLES